MNVILLLTLSISICSRADAGIQFGSPLFLAALCGPGDARKKFIQRGRKFKSVFCGQRTKDTSAAEDAIRLNSGRRRQWIAFAATELDSIQEKMCLAPSILILRLSDKYASGLTLWGGPLPLFDDRRRHLKSSADEWITREGRRVFKAHLRCPLAHKQASGA